MSLGPMELLLLLLFVGALVAVVVLIIKGSLALFEIRNRLRNQSENNHELGRDRQG